MLILWHLRVMQFGPAAPSTLRRRYEIVPRTEKMSACQTLKACNLLGMFLLVCVTVVREPHAQAGSHTTSFSPSPLVSSRLLFLCISLSLFLVYPNSPAFSNLLLFIPRIAIHSFSTTYTGTHTNTMTHTMLVLEMVSAQWLLHWGLNVLSYIGWSLPPGQKAI